VAVINPVRILLRWVDLEITEAIAKSKRMRPGHSTSCPGQNQVSNFGQSRNGQTELGESFPGPDPSLRRRSRSETFLTMGRPDIAEVRPPQ